MVHLNESVIKGLHYAWTYIIKILIVVAFSSLASFIYIKYSLHFEIDYFTLAVKISEKMVTLLPLTVLAFAVGYCPEGSKDRFHIRILLNILAMIFLLFLIHDVSMGLDTDDLIQYGIEVRDSEVHIDFRKLSYLFLILPIFGIIDSYLEHMEYRENEKCSDD